MLYQLILFSILVFIFLTVLFVVRIILDGYKYMVIYEIIVKLQNVIEFLVNERVEFENETQISYKGYIIKFNNYNDLLIEYEILIEDMLNFYEQNISILKYNKRLPIYYEQVLNVYNEIRVLKWSLKND